jgi:altronate hydrolase
MSNLFIRLHPSDDVVIARSQLMSGSNVDGVPCAA